MDVAWRDLDFTLHVLLKIQNPTPRVIAAQNKLADILCGMVEGLQEQQKVSKEYFDAINAARAKLNGTAT